MKAQSGLTGFCRLAQEQASSGRKEARVLPSIDMHRLLGWHQALEKPSMTTLTTAVSASVTSSTRAHRASVTCPDVKPDCTTRAGNATADTPACVHTTCSLNPRAKETKEVLSIVRLQGVCRQAGILRPKLTPAALLLLLNAVPKGGM